MLYKVHLDKELSKSRVFNSFQYPFTSLNNEFSSPDTVTHRLHVCLGDEVALRDAARHAHHVGLRHAELLVLGVALLNLHLLVVREEGRAVL